MTSFWISNTHDAGECEAINEALGHVPPALSGTQLHCTCPAGEHAYFMIVEGETPESVLASLPQEFHIGSTRALSVESVTL